MSTTTVHGACPHDCPDTCAWQVTVEDGRAVKLVGDSGHPFTRGGLCAKVNSYLPERTYHPDRLLHPLRRVSAKGEEPRFERVGWQEAIDHIAARLQGVVERHGAEAILPFNYAGTQGMVQCMSLGERFFAALGASRLEATVCGDNGGAGLRATLGTHACIDPDEIVHSRFIVLWGTNTVVTNLHLWPLVQTARRAGARVVVIDPVTTRTARAADWHVAPAPGTDAALALGMMHVIVADGLHDADYVERHTVGFTRLRERLGEYPPERAAEITGVPADEIVALARAYATTRPAVIRTLIGMEHRRHGAMAFRTISCLPALVGAWRERGGGMVTTVGRHMATALPMDRLERLDGAPADTRAINMMQIGRALTDRELDPPIAALVVYNANPAATSPNQNLVLEGLSRDDLFLVVHDHFLTDTARHADYVLPATTQVEHLDLMYSWGTLYLALNRPAIAPRGEAVSNSELFRRLARAMALDDPRLQAGDEEIIREVLESDHPWAEGITYEGLERDGWAKLRVPEGWRPFADGGFPTPSGRCELFSETMAAEGLDPLPGHVSAAESPAGDPVLAARFPLALIAAKPAVHFLNSSFSGVEHHVRAEGEPVLEMHTDDAAPRGIADGDAVRIHNARGTVVARAHVADRVRRGVVALPSGWWASRSPCGRSANALTSDGISPWGRGGDFHDTLVDVAPVAAEPAPGPQAAAVPTGG